MDGSILGQREEEGGGCRVEAQSGNIVFMGVIVAIEKSISGGGCAAGGRGQVKIIKVNRG